MTLLMRDQINVEKGIEQGIKGTVSILKKIEYRVCGIEEYDYPENRFNSNIVSIHDKNSLLFLP